MLAQAGHGSRFLRQGQSHNNDSSSPSPATSFTHPHRRRQLESCLEASAMNAVQFSTPPPHLLSRHSPVRNTMFTEQGNPHGALSAPSASSTRKRKAEDDGGSSSGGDDRMSASPSASPALSSRPPPRGLKRMRTNVSGRPLPLPRLLETLGADEMRNLLQSICQRHPDLGNEVVSTAPRPSIQSTLQVLSKYESAFQAAFPFGGRSSSDYAYNRVRQQLVELLESLKDFTPHFLPPHEQQPATSLAFLDGATDIIHRLPDWDTYQHNRHKQEAYEEMAKAWEIVIREASKKAGGIQLQYGGWDQKIAKHNDISGGKMQNAVNALRESLGWMSTDAPHPATGSPADAMSIRQQLLSGNYGAGVPPRIGAW